MSSARSNSPHSAPMSIPGSLNRRRAMSTTSTSSEGSPTSPLQTPITPLSTFPPKIATSPSNSAIFSYFMSGTSPAKNNSLPYRRHAGAPPVFEEEETDDYAPLHQHVRRATTAGWPGSNARAPQASPPNFVQPIPEHAQRGAGIMRRLSLSTGFGRPAVPGAAAPVDFAPPRPMTPPPSAINSVSHESNFPASRPDARVGRRATLLGAPEPRPQRVPSPMGERMLKGHFDGFN